MATRDDNFVHVVQGVDPNGAAAPMKIDHATGYALVAIAFATNTPPTTTAGKRDNNYVMSMLATDSSGNFSPILTNHSNDYVWVSTT